MAEARAGGLRLHYQRLGAGERSVVFIHGLVVDNLSSWYFTAANPVAQVAEAVLYDLRGHGKSEQPPAGYQLDDMVGDLAALLEALQLGGRPVDLVGNSYGGLVALAFAMRHPQQARSIVLVDAHLSDEGWGAGMKKTLGLTGAARNAMIARYFKHWLGRHSRLKSNRLAAHARELVHGTSLAADLEASPAYSDAELARVACPVLALYGADSELRPRGERLARVLPACELRLFPGCTHSILWEATALMRDEIVAWVASPLPAPAGGGR